MKSGLARDYHVLPLRLPRIHLVFDHDYSWKLRFYFVFTANCATAALPGNIIQLSITN